MFLMVDIPITYYHSKIQKLTGASLEAMVVVLHLSIYFYFFTEFIVILKLL